MQTNATTAGNLGLNGTDDDMAWLANDAGSQILDTTAAVDGSWPASLPSAQEPSAQPNAPVSSAKCTVTCGSTNSADPLTAFDSSIGRCFLENAITFRPTDRLIACVDAIRMVLQHNRKGLSLAQLHERMKPGFVTKTDSCMVKDDVLFKLLADISADPGDGS